jgi:CDP-glucose 4,6-dehydratase
MDLDQHVWKNRRVLITGHTGFKGSWLTAVLHQFGAEIVGLSLLPTNPRSLYVDAKIASLVRKEYFQDIRDFDEINRILRVEEVDYVFHLAAQPLVRESIRSPRTTLETNILGTSNLLLAIFDSKTIKGCTIVTTDKVYENSGAGIPFAEQDSLGGSDPYSASKAACEIVVSSLNKTCNTRGIPVTTVRAGNVIGGGDWGHERLVPDIVRAIMTKDSIKIRNQNSTRPWQFILDCLQGYLLVAQSHLIGEQTIHGSYNIGPIESVSVLDLIHFFEKAFQVVFDLEQIESGIPEQKSLSLNSSLIRHELGWKCTYTCQEAVQKSATWYLNYLKGQDSYQLMLQDMRDFGYVL